jgi:hypothetical protein
LVHKRLQFRSLWYFSVRQEYVGQCALATNRDLLVTAKNTKPTVQEERLRALAGPHLQGGGGTAA